MHEHRSTERCFIARVGRRRAFKSARQKHLNLSSGKAQPAGDGHLNRTHQTAQQAHRFLGKESMHVNIHRVPWKAVTVLNVRAGPALYTCMSHYIYRLSSLTYDDAYEHAPLSPEGMVTQKLCMCKIKHGPGNHASAAVPRRHRVPCKAGAGCTHEVPPGEKGRGNHASHAPGGCSVAPSQ